MLLLPPLLLLLVLQLTASRVEAGEKEGMLSAVRAERDALGAKVEALAKQVEVRTEKTTTVRTYVYHNKNHPNEELEHFSVAPVTVTVTVMCGSSACLASI